MELRIPPPLVLVIVGLAMWSLTAATPAFAVTVQGTRVAAAGLVVVGLALGVLGAIPFVRARTTIDPHAPQRTSSLIQSGVYRFTRNPMYLGLTVLLLAWAVYLAHPLTLLGLPVFVAYLTRFQIKPEERALEATFGEAYRDYKRRVRRWI